MLQMRLLVFLVVIIFSVQAYTDQEEWYKFKTQYGKVYKNIQENNFRYNVFQSNLKIILEHNKKYDEGKSSYKMYINQFADLTHEEFKQLLNNPKQNNILSDVYLFSKYESDIPDSIDWREKGAVTPIKNQGISGSSCIFGIVGTLEGQYFFKSGNLVSLSEQNLADCTNLGQLCDQEDIYKWLKEKGIMSEADYHSNDGKCHFNESKVVTKISSYTTITPNDELELKKAVGTIGPVAAVIQVTQSFQFYSSGILNDSSCTSDTLNHAVLIAGYGIQDDQDYWIVKNSWGTAWGEQGYILMSRNKNNQCGIAAAASYPTI